MHCPFCQNPDSFVKDSRIIQNGEITRRRRYCSSCKSKFTTFEKVQLRKLFVIKKSGLKKPFDIEKIISSISTAVRKRNISPDQVANIADNIFRELENSGTKDIPTKLIGQMIMNKLADIDQVAYIRFASVYKDFNHVRDFANFINKLNLIPKKE